MTNETSQEKRHYNKAATPIIFLLAVIAALFLFSVRHSNKNSVSPTPSVTPTAAASISSAELSAKTWTWVNTQMSDGSVTTPSEAGKFNATFQKDGKLVAQTDCNSGNGSYTLGPDNSLTIGPMASTMMFCEGSNESTYFQELQNVGSYKISDGQLWLMIKKDSGTMIFK